MNMASGSITTPAHNCNIVQRKGRKRTKKRDRHKEELGKKSELKNQIKQLVCKKIRNLNTNDVLRLINMLDCDWGNEEFQDAKGDNIDNGTNFGEWLCNNRVQVNGIVLTGEMSRALITLTECIFSFCRNKIFTEDLIRIFAESQKTIKREYDLVSCEDEIEF